MKHDPNVCTLKKCDRSKAGPGPLVCPAHWALVPAALKRALWAAMKIRSQTKRELEIWSAADRILKFLEKLKVQLPPEVKLAKPDETIEKPDAKIITSGG